MLTSKVMITFVKVMGVNRESSKIALIRLKVEETFGKAPKVHNDFVELAEEIKNNLKRHISETTLERVWGYSGRGYDTVSLHTLDMLSLYAGKDSWAHFCHTLQDEGLKDSDLFEGDYISSCDLKPGERLQIGWLPDRLCTIEFKGNNQFVALECQNATMQSGDSFLCNEFIINQPAVMDKFVSASDPSKSPKRYVAGIKHGLSILKKL